MTARRLHLGRIGLITVVAWLGVLALAGARASDPEAMLERYFEGTETLQGRFQQDTYDDRGERVEAAEGDFWMARGERFRWHYQSPWEQLIVADGERLWVHDVDLDQVTVQPLEEALGVGAAQLLSGEFSDLQANFRIEPGDTADTVRLRPTDPAWDFQTIRLTFDDGLPTRLDIDAGLGDRIEVQLRDITRNQPIEPERFEYTPPAEADVLQGP